VRETSRVISDVGDFDSAFFFFAVLFITSTRHEATKERFIMRFSKLFVLTTILGFAGTAIAQEIPGKDRPIRVGMFKGTGTGSRYWHTNIHTSHTVLAGILANPAGANLGDSLVIPTAGFSFYSMPIALNTAGTAECTGNGCGPNATQIAGFVAAMDTLDVIIMSSVVDWGSRVSNVTQREAFQNFWNTKGYVAIHAITDTYGTWAPLDTIHGARFRGHPAEQNGTIRRDSVFETDTNYRYLNRGVFSNGIDTTFFEEWFYFTTTAATIRSQPHLKPTVKLVEASIANPGSQAPMGDHPHSWYKQLPTGGRFFYTAVGHRSQVWQTVRSFRRQVYNGILWTAKYDSLATVTSIRHNGKAPGVAQDYSRLSVTPGALTVTMIPSGSHTVELLSVDGKRIAFQQGEGRDKSYQFTGLRAGVYAVSVGTSAGRSNRLVTVQ
jgi:type 1 glutamine amidotransferase